MKKMMELEVINPTYSSSLSKFQASERNEMLKTDFTGSTRITVTSKTKTTKTKTQTASKFQTDASQ